MCALHALSWADWVVRQLIRHPLWGVDCRSLVGRTSVARTFHVSSICFAPAVATTALLSFLPVYPRRLCDTSFTSTLSDIFSKTLHRKLPGRKFPFHVRISLAIPEPAGAFSLPGYHLFDTSVLSWQWWAQSVGGSLLWEQSPGKVITGSEACVQSTGVRDLCAASLMF